MTYNTGNPIGSTDARDRLDNSENLDLAVNSLSQTFVDRLGRTRDTLEGIYQKSAYYRAGTFDAGYTLTNNRQTLAYGNIEYSWSGAFPKVVSAGSTPATSGGIGAGAWVDRTQDMLRDELESSAATLLGFKQSAESIFVRTFIDRFSSDEVKVKDFGAVADGSIHTLSELFTSLSLAQVVFPFVTSLSQSIDWAAAQMATNIAVTQAASLIIDGSATETTYKTGAFASVEFDRGIYHFGADAVTIPAQSTKVNIEWRSNSGAAILGDNQFNLNGGARKNKFFKLVFGLAQKAIRVDTSNANESMLIIEQCESHGNDIFLDTVSYAASRSTMIHIKDFVCGYTRVMVDHYTDHMRIENAWMYAKKGSYDALLRLSGDGVVTIDSSFFIPHGEQIPTPANSRFIDFISDSANSSPADRSIKQLKITNSRMSLESARGFIWTFDNNNAVKPEGNNQVSSIVIEDSYVGGTGGLPVVEYREGYPGSVILRNCRGFACNKIVSVAASNLSGPVPSSPSALTYHVVMIDEATRLAQSNSNNSLSLVDPALEPFCYDTTSQTSKYKRSIKKNIDYRLPVTAAPGAGAIKVKVTIPVFFDSAPPVANRDILSFMLVTVSDGGATAAGDTGFRATATSIISVVGGDDGGTKKRIVTTTLQDAKGGLSGFTDVSAVPTVFWGQGDTGSADISKNSTSGTEDFITAVWTSSDVSTSWAYIIPLAGLRENQQDKMQYGVW